MQFSELTTRFEILESTPSRNAMTEQLAALFKDMDASEAGPICYLSLGRLRPLFDRLDFNLADKMVVRSLAQAYQLAVDQVAKQYKDIGDIGELAAILAASQPDSDRSVQDVYDHLVSIAQESGAGSQDRKVTGLADLLTALDAASAKYVARIIVGKLRLGFSDKTILDALSVMETGSKQGRKELDAAYQVFPDVGRLATLVKEHGIKGISHRVTPTIGVPLMPALAQRLKTPEEMIDKMGEVLVEPKYDGTRVQIHIDKDKGVIKTFTRNLDETTHMFPELARCLEQIDANKIILDSEAVGVDSDTGKLLPFQATITRKRKHGIEDAADKVPLKFFIFDVLYVDGESLLEVPMQERRQRLEKLIHPGDILVVDPADQTQDPEVLRQLHQKYLDEGLEGAVIKKVNGAYKPGRQGHNWVKFKEVETAAGKLADTIDCVVMGYYAGKGKRTSFGIGAFLVGIKNTKTGEYQTLAKVGTGLTDEQWKTLRQKLESEVSASSPKDYVVDKSLVPDIWTHPAVVVEIAADEITTSPNHSSGVALRFPRLVRFRDDKDAQGITTLEEVRTIQANS